MGLFSKRSQVEERKQETAEAPECPHGTLTPHWDSLDDMGNQMKVSYYQCDGCGQTFEREEGERRRSEGMRRFKLAS